MPIMFLSLHNTKDSCPGRIGMPSLDLHDMWSAFCVWIVKNGQWLHILGVLLQILAVRTLLDFLGPFGPPTAEWDAIQIRCKGCTT